MTELKPCPFCGGTPTLEEPGADGAQRVVCRNTRCFGPATSPVVYAADAIAMWNRRPSPSISEGEVEAAARFICAEIIGVLWDGLTSGSIVARGYKPFVYSEWGGRRFQGGHEDLRDIARALLAASKARATTEVEVGWQPITTARKQVDETVLLRIEHMNYAIASDEDKHRWQEVVTAYWTDFNTGGWVWHGLTGTPTHWREIPAPPRTP